MMCGYYYFDNKYNEGKDGDILDILELYEDVSAIEDDISSTLCKYESYYKGSNEKTSIISDNKEYIEDNEIILTQDGGWSYKNTDIEYEDQ